jgi:hypothetical protein
MPILTVHDKELQRQFNSGIGWKFEGSYGRAMMDKLNSGEHMLGRESSRDYYGNKIPSRYEVKSGTKGSFKYVEQAMGRSYALAIARVK